MDNRRNNCFRVVRNLVNELKMCSNGVITCTDTKEAYTERQSSRLILELS